MNLTTIYKTFDMILTEKNFTKCPDKHGQYLIFHRRNSRAKCLYVGASIRLNIRATRYFGEAKNAWDNYYLGAMISGLPKNEIHVGIKFSNACDLTTFTAEEKQMIKACKPLFNNPKLPYIKREYTINFFNRTVTAN